MYSTGCSAALIPLFALSQCHAFTVTLSFKLLQTVSSLAYDVPILARDIAQPAVMRMVLNMHGQLPAHQKSAAVAAIHVAVRWGSNSSLVSAEGSSSLGDDISRALASHLDLTDALAALRILCDAGPLRTNSLAPASFVPLLLQPHHWRNLSSQVHSSSPGISPGMLAAYSLSLMHCMLDHQWEDVAVAVGMDASLLSALASIWTRSELSAVMRAHALSLAAAAAAGPAADTVLDAFTRIAALPEAAVKAIVEWDDIRKVTGDRFASAMDLIVLQHATALVGSLCGRSATVAIPGTLPTSPSAARSVLSQRMLTPQLIRAALHLLRASNDAVRAHAVSIICAFAAASTRNKLRFVSDGAISALTGAAATGQHSVRAAALDALAVLLLPDNSVHSFPDDAAGSDSEIAAAARAQMDALMPALVSAAGSGDLLVDSALPLLHYVVDTLDAVEHFSAR